MGFIGYQRQQCLRLSKVLFTLVNMIKGTSNDYRGYKGVKRCINPYKNNLCSNDPYTIFIKIILYTTLTVLFDANTTHTPHPIFISYTPEAAFHNLTKFTGVLVFYEEGVMDA